MTSCAIGQDPGGSPSLHRSELNREVIVKDTIGPKAINFFRISIVDLVDVCTYIEIDVFYIEMLNLMLANLYARTMDRYHNNTH